MQKEPVKLKDCLLSAAIGDICGSPWEFSPFKGITIEGFRESLQFNYTSNTRFEDTPLNQNSSPTSTFTLIGNSKLRRPRFPSATDDTICTFALAEAVLDGKDMQENMVRRCLQHINVGYGPGFRKWLTDSARAPYNSFGNGAAMRCSIAGWFPETEDAVDDMAAATAAPTHNHPEGIKGAQATARAIFSGRTGFSKEEIVNGILDMYPDEWKNVSWNDIVAKYRFDVTCQGSVPVVALALRESDSFEECIFRCVQSGGDSDTLGAIAGPIAYAFYREIPQWMILLAEKRLPEWCLEVNARFNALNGF